MKVKKIKLDPELEEVFGKHITAKDLNKYINNYDIHKELNLINEFFEKHFPTRHHLIKERKRRLEYQKEKDVDTTNKYEFMPGMAGMPFSPYTETGPHFHPPTVVHVDSIMDPNNPSNINPHLLEKFDYEKQTELMKKTMDTFKVVEDLLNGTTNYIDVETLK